MIGVEICMICTGNELWTNSEIFKSQKSDNEYIKELDCKVEKHNDKLK